MSLKLHLIAKKEVLLVAILHCNKHTKFAFMMGNPPSNQLL